MTAPPSPTPQSTVTDGGPAFPNLRRDAWGKIIPDPTQPGMSLLDYFAAAALQGLLAGQWNARPHQAEPPPLSDNIETMAYHAYLIASAMLKARDQRP